MRIRAELTGQVFGTRTVLGRSDRQGRNTYWHVKCQCGRESEVTTASIRAGAGCPVCVPTRHGLSHSPEHDTWLRIKQRCTNPNSLVWRYYGGRGIKITAAWLNSFETFLADMGPRPSPGHSIERRDNDGDYTPENCYWAARSQQMRNTRQSARWTYGGRSLTVVEWSEATGIPANTLRMRVNSYGWTIDRALTTPVR